MSKYNEKLIRSTIKFWQPYVSKPLTALDAEDIISNSIKLFKKLLEYYKKEWDELCQKAVEEKLRGLL